MDNKSNNKIQQSKHTFSLPPNSIYLHKIVCEYEYVCERDLLIDLAIIHCPEATHSCVIQL